MTNNLTTVAHNSFVILYFTATSYLIPAFLFLIIVTIYYCNSMLQLQLFCRIPHNLCYFSWLWLFYNVIFSQTCLFVTIVTLYYPIVTINLKAPKKNFLQKNHPQCLAQSCMIFNQKIESLISNNTEYHLCMLHQHQPAFQHL